MWSKAVTYCHQAGVRAHSCAAFREMAAAYEQALQSLGHLREDNDTQVLAVKLRLGLADALHELGEYGRRRALLGEAMCLTRTLEDRALRGRVLIHMAIMCRSTGDYDDAIVAGQKALTYANELSDSALQIQASYSLGLIYSSMGDFVQAAALLRKVEAMGSESGTPATDWLIQLQARLAWLLGMLGAFAEGRRHGEEAFRLARLTGRGSTLITAYGSLGHLYLAQGSLECAINLLD